MINRRRFLTGAGAASLLAVGAPPAWLPPAGRTRFRFCLNTSTISGSQAGLARYVEIAAAAGYDGIEIWVRDLQAYQQAGGSLPALARQLRDAKLTVENAIGFAPWMVPDADARAQGLAQLEAEMNLLAEVGCRRIAAPPAGLPKGQPVDLLPAGRYYREALDLGRRTGVMPQLEFWGASGTVYHLGQALAIAAAASDPDARLLPDVYHLFRGGSDFEGLRLVQGDAIEVFHVNDYPGDKAREAQEDRDRVFPGEGVAPFPLIMDILRQMGGTKVLSLELFNPTYWQRDPLAVAREGLARMRAVVRG